MNTSNPPPRALWLASLFVAVLSAALVMIGLRRRAVPAPVVMASPPARLLPSAPGSAEPRSEAQPNAPPAGTLLLLLACGVFFALLANTSMANREYGIAFAWSLVAGLQWAVAIEMADAGASFRRAWDELMRQMREPDEPSEEIWTVSSDDETDERF